MPTPFATRADHFRGVTVELGDAEAALGPGEFGERLEYWLGQWEAEGKRGIWLNVSAQPFDIPPRSAAAWWASRHAPRRQCPPQLICCPHPAAVLCCAGRSPCT
jgi:hypothetical protein